MWLSPAFLNWRILVQVAYNDLDWKRAYEIWAHSERILQQYNDEFHLTDAITTLKRAMSHRLQLLKTIYRLDTIPLPKIPKRAIEQLAFLGIVRPTMLSRLIEIRNMIEHEDAAPPTCDRCIELLDFVWYFLRSTDRAGICQPTEIEFESTPYTEGVDNTYTLVLGMNPQNNWRLGFGAWVSASMLQENGQHGWFEVEVNRKQTRDEARQGILDSQAHEKRKVDDLRVEGLLVGPECELRRVFELYFELAVTGL